MLNPYLDTATANTASYHPFQCPPVASVDNKNKAMSVQNEAGQNNIFISNKSIKTHTTVNT